MTLSDSRHPIEILHNGRDEIQRAVSEIEQRERPTTDELNATGSAMVTVLSSLQQLADAVTNKLYAYSEAEINQHTEQDNPVDDYRKAIDRAQHLRGILSVAFADADQYWSAIRRVHEHTDAESARPSNHGQDPAEGGAGG